MRNITNMDIYNSRMRLSMLDKLWFLDKIPDTIIRLCDYGCADGTLLKMAGEINPLLELSGYDNNPEMIALAVKNVPQAAFWRFPITLPAHSVLNASSVFHEIHSYSSDVEKEYKNIFESGAEYIAIRDMFYDEAIEKYQTPTYELKNVQLKADKKLLNEFEEIWGPITYNRNFVHFLLKYRYVENWDREVRENYFPHTFSQFLDKISKYNYTVVYSDFYTLPYIREKVYEDFGFVLYDFTHAKFLLKRKN